MQYICAIKTSREVIKKYVLSSSLGGENNENEKIKQPG